MEDEEEGEEGGKGAFDKTIMPEVVVVLDAADDFLKERIMNLPEEVVQVRGHCQLHHYKLGLNKELEILQ